MNNHRIIPGRRSLVCRYAFSFCIAFSGLSCDQKDPAPATLKEAIDHVATPYVALGADVGIIIGVMKEGQKSVYSYGEKEIGSRESITAQSVLEIASLTKVYTAVALADMHLRKELNLDDPIENYLPSSVHVPMFNNKKITLRHLANHTSGFPRFASNADKKAYNEYKGYTEQMMYEFINGYTLTRAPGSEFEYSAVGYGLLGQILSLKTQSDYETMITGRVLSPLGMKHTTISFTPEQMKHLVPGHNGNKQVESWSKDMQNIVQGTGALISTMDDQLIYLEANLGLINSSLDEALSLSHELTFQHDGKYTNGIGLGWNHFTLNGQHVIWKNGGNGGYTSFMGFNPDHKTGVVVLTNSSLNPEIFATDMGIEILKLLQVL